MQGTQGNAGRITAVDRVIVVSSQRVEVVRVCTRGEDVGGHLIFPLLREYEAEMFDVDDFVADVRRWAAKHGVADTGAPAEVTWLVFQLYTGRLTAISSHALGSTFWGTFDADGNEDNELGTQTLGRLAEDPAYVAQKRAAEAVTA